MIVNVNPLKAGYKPEQLQGLYQQIEDRFHAMPGVENVGLSLYTPLERNTWSFWVYVQGQRPPDPGQEIGRCPSTARVRNTSRRLGSRWFGDARLLLPIRRLRREWR